MMTLDEYQKQAATTDQMMGRDTYYALGLAGETGEVVEIVKKRIRAETVGAMIDSPAMSAKMLGELGDVLWYLSRLAEAYGFTLEEVAVFNLDKLRSRAVAGTLSAMDRPAARDADGCAG